MSSDQGMTVEQAFVSREFEMTEGILDVCCKKLAPIILLDDEMREMFAAALAHPDFRAQLRAWAAEEMRGLVPQPAYMDDDIYNPERAYRHGRNACRAETLANIERWEKGNE